MGRHPRSEGQEIARVHRNNDGSDRTPEGEDRCICRLPSKLGHRDGALCRVAQAFSDANQGFRAAFVKKEVQRCAPSGAGGPDAG